MSKQDVIRIDGCDGASWIESINSINYYVNLIGQIMGPSGKILSQMKSKDNHCYVFIHGKKRWVHRIVLEAFCGECPSGMECRHLDGNPLNNQLKNLKWGTKKENTNDRRIHGTLPLPQNSKDTKLVPEDIPEIKRLHGMGFSSRKIADKFKTSHTTIQKIIRGERWVNF